MIGPAVFLCNRTAVAPQPWLDAGIACITVDLEPADGAHPLRTHLQLDVRALAGLVPRPCFVAAFPPCTDLAASGARWFKGKGLGALAESIKLVNACATFCAESGAPYMIENPVGTLSTYWRPPDFAFDPCDYGDPYTKRTLLWTGGGFVMPPVIRPGDLFDPATWVAPTLGSLMREMGETLERPRLRSLTPAGFARAVFEANDPRAR